MKKEEVKQILSELVGSFLDDDEMLFTKILAKRGIRASNIPYWINKDESIKDLVDELKELQELKVYSALMNPSTKNITGLLDLINLNCSSINNISFFIFYFSYYFIYFIITSIIYFIIIYF